MLSVSMAKLPRQIFLEGNHQSIIELRKCLRLLLRLFFVGLLDYPDTSLHFVFKDRSVISADIELTLHGTEMS